jgi:hypothetical protein
MLIGRSSDLLPVYPAFPPRLAGQWPFGWITVVENTAAGLSGIHTRFPFNSVSTETKSVAKVNIYKVNEQVIIKKDRLKTDPSKNIGLIY